MEKKADFLFSFLKYNEHNPSFIHENAKYGILAKQPSTHWGPNGESGGGECGPFLRLLNYEVKSKILNYTQSSREVI